MAYHLAFDVGGTKTLVILYDEQFRPLRCCRTGSLRRTNASAELIEQHLAQIMDTLGLRGMTIESANGVVCPDVVDKLRRDMTIHTASFYTENVAGLSAAGITGDGYMVVSGTGATTFARIGNDEFAGGGYGALLDDEGSGYWLARKAFQAAIRDYEQRGKPTRLRELLVQKLGKEGYSFRQAICAPYFIPDVAPISAIAACAPLVKQAAREGDAVAERLLINAGRSLGEQLEALARRESLPKTLPITISGGAWRENPIMFAEFSRTLRELGMDGEILVPSFDPIVGAILRHYFDTVGDLTPAVMARFKELYQDYLFTI